MAEQQRAQLNRSMEKSFEDLLTGLDSDLEPDIDDLFTNYDHLPEKVTDSTLNAMAFQSIQKIPSPAPSSEKEEEEVEEEEEYKPDDKDVYRGIQLPRAVKNTDPGIESESEEEEEEKEQGQLEFVSSNQEREDVYDSSKLILPTVGESSTDNTLLENVELEEEEEEEEEKEDDEDGREDEEEEEEEMEEQNQSKDKGRMTDQKDLTLFSGLDHDDSDPDIDKLVAECDFLPETVTDSTINAMVDRNRPLVKSYAQSQEEQIEKQDDEESMETDSDTEESPEPEVKLRIHKEASLDFSVLEPDSNHLGVDIGKQKTDLRKRGSLAKRRKPTRSTVRSTLLSGEEAMFQDSTEPKTETADRKDDTDDVFAQRSSTSSVEGTPTSPPAKKPSKVMVPLPGFGGPKPELRRRSEEQHEAEMAVDEPKKKDFRSYGVKLPVPQVSRTSETEETLSKPVLRKVPRKDIVEKQEEEIHYDVSSLKSVKKGERDSRMDSDSDKFFEKPSLRQVSRDDSKDKTSSDMTFEKPALKTVSRQSPEKSNESEMKFEIPTLKQVSRKRSESNNSEKESDSTFSKPSLKSTPKPPEEKSAPTTPKTPEPKTFELPSLRPTPKADRGKPVDTQEDTRSFEKPALRNVSRRLESKTSDETGSFEKPTLRNVAKPPLPEKRTSIAEDESDEKHKFDVPALRMVPRDARPTETLRNVARTEKDTEVEAIRRPSLKATPRKEPPKIEEGKETPSWLKNMKLRKTKSQADDINRMEESKEKPEWLQAASEKGEKALESLNSKENITKTSSDKKVPWLSRDNLKKTPTPLQENNDISHSNHDEARRRLSSVETNGDLGTLSRERTPSKTDATRENYVPSWQKAQDNRHKSNPNLSFVTPTTNSEETPDWKKVLAEKKKNRRDSDTPVKQPPVADGQESNLPPWKKELAKKGMKPSVPVKAASESKKTEPEWKQKADEKRQRIIRTGLFDKTLRKT